MLGARRAGPSRPSPGDRAVRDTAVRLGRSAGDGDDVGAEAASVSIQVRATTDTPSVAPKRNETNATLWLMGATR